VRTKGRRRLDATLIVGGSLVAGGLSAFGAGVYNEARLERMWVGAAIDADGTAAIHEVIDDNFGSFTTENHGIERKVPGLTPSSPFVVSSPTAPDGIASVTPIQVDGVAGIAVRVGDPNQTITGRHRYVIDYRLDTLMEGDELAFDGVGTQWDLSVEGSEIEVVAPWAFEDPVCQQGEFGSTDPCEVTQPEPGRLRVVVDETLPAGHGVTVRATRGEDLPTRPELPAAPAEPPADEGAGIAQPAAVAALAAVGGGLTTSRLVRRAGRERVSSGAAAGAAADVAYAAMAGSEQLVDAADLADLATTEFAPPDGITAPMGGILMSESVEPNHKIAWLIEAAIAGAIDLQEEDGKVKRIVRLAPGDPDTSPVLDKAFGGRTTIELGTYDPTFASGWTQLDSVLDGWAKGSGLWDASADRRKTIVRVCGVVFGTISMGLGAVGAALAARYDPAWLALVAAGSLGAGIGWAALIRGWELKVRTPLGSGMWLRVESFRRFLHESEGYHAEQAAQRGVLREYTAWAVAIGELDRWKKAVESSTVIPESSGLSYVYMAPFLASSVSSSATAPSSSGSGGGGGGGSGGGGGGGGGGNW
jgi:hypothetical protein